MAFGKELKLNFKYGYSPSFLSSLTLQLIKLIINILKRFLRKEKLEVFCQNLNDFFFPEDIILLPRERYQKLIQGKENSTRRIIDLENRLKTTEKEVLELKKELEFTRTKYSELTKKESEIQEKIDKLEIEKIELQSKFEKTLGEKEKTLKENQDLRDRLEEKEKQNQELSAKVESLQKTLEDNSFTTTSKILKKLLPNMEFLRNSLQYIVNNLDAQVLDILREIRFNGGQIKAIEVESAPNFLERHLGDACRLYFERPSKNGIIRVLISPKNCQTQDIKYLKSLRE